MAQKKKGDAIIVMVSLRIVKVRVTRDQLDRIKLNAPAKGFITVAGYIRYLCLEYNQHLEAKILENNKILKEIVEFLNSKNQHLFSRT